MPLKLEGSRKPFHPKPDTEITCEEHGLTVRWGDLSSIQQLAVEEGIDTADHLPCILSPEMR